MQDKHPHPDLLRDEDVREVTYRSLLLPIWFKVCMAIIVFVHGSEALQFLKLRATLDTFSGPQHTWPLVTYLLYCSSSLATIAVCLLLHLHSRYAVKAALPVFCGTLLLGGVSLAGHVAADRGLWPTTIAVANVVAMAIAVVHLFRIRKEWAVAETVL